VRLRTAVLAAGVALLAAGCNSHVYGSLGNQVAEFYFTGSATAAMKAHAVQACSGLKGTSPYALPRGNAPLASQVYSVRFDVTHASNAQLQALLNCMSRQKGVTGFNIPDQGGF
jgi:hypothetical protein